VIQAQNLTKRYGRAVVVDGVNLDVHAGEIFGFLGPNGAGKTTTLKMILGLIKPTSGSVHLLGECYTPERLDMRRRIGVVPERHPYGMWRWMTGIEYLQMFAELYRVAKPGKRIGPMLERLGLADAVNRRLVNYSKGMIQKLSFVRALLPDPDILFLDEPISGLDPIGVEQTRDLILAENREGRTVFISSHMLSEMERLCHRLAIIHWGKIISDGPMESLVHGLNEEQQIVIELETITPALVEALCKLDCVHTVERATGNTIVVTVPHHRDYRREISQFFFGQGVAPLSISVKGISLQEAFLTITRENVETIAKLDVRK
jgi:ABC-type multidrug transport system ATPase subunit